MDTNEVLKRFDPTTKEVMEQVIAFFDTIENSELVVGFWKGEDSSNNYLRHNYIGKTRGAGIYFNNTEGDVLIAHVKPLNREFVFGEKLDRDNVVVMLNCIKRVLN